MITISGGARQPRWVGNVTSTTMEAMSKDNFFFASARWTATATAARSASRSRNAEAQPPQPS